jgi:hypothetical protein
MVLLQNDYVAPYDDSQMKYSLDRHYYIPELDYIEYETGINLSLIWQGIDNAKWYLDRVASVVHTYVLQFRDTKFHTRLVYYLSHSEFARQALSKIFVDIVQYNHEDGGFLIAYQTGVNLHEMKDIEIKIKMAMSVIGDQIIKNLGLKQRYDNINRNTFTYYDTLEDLVEYLEDESIVTEEEAEEIEDVTDIPTSYLYRTFINTKGQYVYEDLRTFETAMLTYGVDW